MQDETREDMTKENAEETTGKKRKVIDLNCYSIRLSINLS